LDEHRARIAARAKDAGAAGSEARLCGFDNRCVSDVSEQRGGLADINGLRTTPGNRWRANTARWLLSAAPYG